MFTAEAALIDCRWQGVRPQASDPSCPRSCRAQLSIRRDHRKKYTSPPEAFACCNGQEPFALPRNIPT